MKPKHVWWKWLAERITTLCLFISASSGGAFAAATVASPEPSAEADIPKSVFVDDPRSARDPFFPNSTRRKSKPVTQEPRNGTTPPAPQPVQLTLHAILVGQSKKLAQINNRNFEAGEEAEILAGNQKLKIRCLEINDSSVRVRIEGTQEVRELSLRKR
jgi:hypothetical protein